MTRHLGSLTSCPLSEYTGPVGREMRGRAVYMRKSCYLVNVIRNTASIQRYKTFIINVLLLQQLIIIIQFPIGAK